MKTAKRKMTAIYAVSEGWRLGRGFSSNFNTPNRDVELNGHLMSTATPSNTYIAPVQLEIK